MAVKKAMRAALAAVIKVIANYLTSIIDGQGLGRKSTGIIERCVTAIAVEKAVIDAGSNISDSSDNLSRFVKV